MGNTLAVKPGAAAVLNYSSAYPFNDGAFTDPANNLGLFKWHSGLYYLGCDQILTGTVNLQYQSSGWFVQGNGFARIIAAHGKNYAPIVLGYFTIDGFNVPINGTTLLNGTGTVSGQPSCISINAYADATNVVLKMDTVYKGYLKNVTNINYTLYVCNMGDNGGLVVPPYYAGTRIFPTSFRAGYFDPQTYGYFYRDAGGPITIYKDRSIDVDVGAYPPSQSYFMLGCRQDINGYSCTFMRSASKHDTSPWNRDWPGTPGFTPSVERVSITAAGASGLRAQPNYIQLGAGFNSNQNTLLVSNYQAANLDIPKYSTSGSGIYRTDTFDLGPCHPAASLLLGTYTLNGQTYSIGGTNYSKLLTFTMGPSQSYTANSTGFVLPAVGQTFYLSPQSGRMIATVRSFCPRGVTANLTASSIACKILAATFDY